jgi:hypothetical protein
MKFFEHSATQKAYWHLSALGEDVSKMNIPPFPPEFYQDVRSGYGIVIKRYEDALQELRQRRWLFDFDSSLTRRLHESGYLRQKTGVEPRERMEG